MGELFMTEDDFKLRGSNDSNNYTGYKSNSKNSEEAKNRKRKRGNTADLLNGPRIQSHRISRMKLRQITAIIIIYMAW